MAEPDESEQQACAVIRMAAAEAPTQQRETAREARLDRAHRDPGLPCDVGRRALLEVALKERGAVGLVEREHEFEKLALERDALRECVLVCGRARVRGEFLAPASMPFGARAAQREIARDARQPWHERALFARPVLERRDPSVLREVVGRVRVVNETAGEPPQPAGLRKQLLGIRSCTLGHAASIPLLPAGDSEFCADAGKDWPSRWRTPVGAAAGRPGWIECTFPPEPRLLVEKVRDELAAHEAK